jgi:hypothetical protein
MRLKRSLYKKCIIYTVLATLIISGGSHCFGYEWEKTSGGRDADQGFSETTDDGFIIAGRTNSFGAGHEDVYLIKSDSKSNLQAFPKEAGAGSCMTVNCNAIDTNVSNEGTVKTSPGSGTDITVYSGVSSAHKVIDVLGYYYYVKNNFAPVPVTGQTQSYALGDDGDLEMGVQWPNPRFTDNENGTVTDNLTGLIWLKNAGCLGSKNWNAALQVSNNLADGQCGLSDGSNIGDWRLSNVNELYSLIDRGHLYLALPSGHPFTGVQFDYYWTSTSRANFPERAWTVYVNYGHVGGSYYKDEVYNVWPVRGGDGEPLFAPVPVTGQTQSYALGDDGDLEMGVQWPNPRFTDNENGTVTDNLTGLIWLKNAGCLGSKNWNAALQVSNNLADGQCGLSDGSNIGDWRLSNVNELYSLIDHGHANPALHSGHPFTGVQFDYYWTSTSRANFPERAWTVMVGSGHQGSYHYYKDDFYNVWPVRGGRGGQFGFIDVPPGSFAEEEIYKIFNAGITAGCSKSPLKYCPTSPVTRAQMAIFLLKTKLGSGYTPPPATGIFDDVPVGSFAEPWIEDLYNRGITAGCQKSPLRYCPTSPVTRAQMAIFLLKTKLGSGYTPPPATGIFDDVPVGSFREPWIEDLYNRGITAGCQKNPLLYCPDSSTTRAQMAVFLVRTFGL